MGLSNAISGGIVMVTMVLVILSMPFLLDSTLVVQDAATEISELETKISQTNISTSSLVGNLGSNLITFILHNDDSEKLWNFEKFSLLITFDGDTSGRLTESLAYNGVCSGSPPSGFWCYDSISPDILDPGILNENEFMNIKATVSENLTSGILLVVVSTDNGVTTTISAAV